MQLFFQKNFWGSTRLQFMIQFNVTMLPRVQKFIKKIELDSSQSKILFLKKQKTLEQNFKKKTLWPIFIDGVQLSQGYRATMRRHFTFHHSVPRSSWYSLDRLQENERLNLGPQDWESSALTNRPLLHKGDCQGFCKI